MRKRSEPKRIWSGPKNGREWQRNCEGYWLAGVAAERRPSYSVYWWNLDSSFSSYRHVGASWGPLAVILVHCLHPFWGSNLQQLGGNKRKVVLHCVT